MKKFLIWLGVILLAIIILAVVGMFLLPKENHVEVQKTISAPKVMVYNALNDLQAHQVWNPWKKMDESMKIEFGEKTKGKGAQYTWTSEKMGNGTYTIANVNPYESLSSNIDFGGKGGGQGTFSLKENQDKTDVTWGFDWEAKGLMKLMAPFMKGSMKKTFSSGLDGLDEMIQKRKAGDYYGYKVQEFLMDRQDYILKRQRISNERVQQFYASNLGSLFNSMQESDVQMVGRPSGLIYNWEKDRVDIAAAIPVGENIVIDGTVSESILPGPAVQVDYYGNYDGLDNVHRAIQSYLDDKGLVHDWPVIVEYVTDPAEEENPDKWLTKVIYKLGAQ